MKPRSGQAKQCGLTLIEVLLIMVTILLLIGLMLPRIRMRPPNSRIRCVRNLKNVGLAFRIFATDNGDRFPMQIPGENGGTQNEVEDPRRVWRHFAVMSNELSTPKILICPEDRYGRKEAGTWSAFSTNRMFVPFAQNANISYFVGLDATVKNPQMILSGDRNITNAEPNHFTFGPARVGILGTNHSSQTGAGWDYHLHERRGNVGMADGSVQQTSTPRLREALRTSGDSRNRLASPD